MGVWTFVLLYLYQVSFIMLIYSKGRKKRYEFLLLDKLQLEKMVSSTCVF